MFHDHAAPIVLVVEDEWLVREEIAHTVAVPDDVEDELRHFIAVLQT